VAVNVLMIAGRKVPTFQKTFDGGSRFL